MPELPTRTFRLELGINLGAAAQVKTRWGDRFFSLENALVDVTSDRARPAWYTHLRPGDRLSVRLVDITDLRAPRSPDKYPALIDFHFVDPDTGKPRSPFDDPPESWVLKPEEDRYSPVFSREVDQTMPTWDIVGRSPDDQPVDLIFASVKTSFQRFELSVVLQVERDGHRDVFSFDPEMIIGDTGGVGPDPDPPDGA